MGLGRVVLGRAVLRRAGLGRVVLGRAGLCGDCMLVNMGRGGDLLVTGGLARRRGGGEPRGLCGARWGRVLGSGACKASFVGRRGVARPGDVAADSTATWVERGRGRTTQ